MSSNIRPARQLAKQLNEDIRAVLEAGSRAVLVTLIQSTRLVVGAKLLIRDDHVATGDLGDQNLNAVLIAEASRFLAGRDEARTARVSEIAGIAGLRGFLVLFERIEVEPQL
jgi:xanthine/CO dehydrogenase XdhC/CoxF family maturation factor